jgi:hypothetical protein
MKSQPAKNREMKRYCCVSSNGSSYAIDELPKVFIDFWTMA